MNSQKNKLTFEEIELIRFLDELEQNDNVKKVKKIKKVKKVNKIKKIKVSDPNQILEDLTNINQHDEYSVHDLCYGIEIKDKNIEMLPNETDVKFVEIPIYHPPTKPNCKKLKSNKIYTRFC